MYDIENFIPPEERDPNRFSIKIYNENHEEIINPDLEKGWLEDGGEQNEYGEWRMTQIYHPYTVKELEVISLEKEKNSLMESRKQLSQDEVISIFLRMKLNELDIPDQMSLRMVDYYPDISDVVGKTVKMGFKFRSDGKLYKTIQPDVTIKSISLPDDRVDIIYEEIKFNYTGKIYDPIPYEGGIKLENGKYYAQSDVVYLCKRNSENYVNRPLKDLVGTLLEVLE